MTMMMGTTTTTITMTMTTETMTTNADGTTTESSTRYRFSVRQRIIAGVSSFIALALLAVGVTVAVVETRRINLDIDEQLAREVAEFRTSAEADPTMTADQLLDDFLAANLPDTGEILWAFPPAGQPTFVGDEDGDSTLRTSTLFRSTVDELSSTGGFTTIEVAGTKYRMVVQPLTADGQTGALVVTQNISVRRGELHDLLLTYAMVAVLSLLVVTALSSVLARRLLQPVSDLREAAEAMSVSSFGERLEVTGNDDLAELQRTFNAMLDRLESAFSTQRQLLDDASHELRTPLTIMRGHLELMDAADPEDVAATRALLLDESDRMARLVDDLLMLAKSRRPDFVRFEPTGLSALTHGIFDRVRALGDRQWQLDAVAEGTAELDGQRLTQAMMQLAENAVKHTEPGQVIAVGSRWVENTVELWVRDTGRGVAPQDRDRIFERFSQADPTSEGFGLGLSIVGAIAEAHHGRATLDPTAEGATFRLTLGVEA